MQQGTIFDIHRFSLNDGPGIRTTVFLKGCPLHCDWCHNPESQSHKPQISFNPDKCIDCMECVTACPNGAHENVNGKHKFIRELCISEAECVKVCSSGALKIIGYSENIENIIIEVLKDSAYYSKTGGGITISGGEPMAQFEFTKELLSAAKDHNVHTCLDTCGIAKPAMYKEILPLVNLFLFDYKLTDSKEHKKLTGAGSELILENLDLLYRYGANIILRCPIIPDINDNAKHFEGIISLMQKFPDLIEVQLMPYHSLGRDKEERVGMEYKMAGVKDADEHDKHRWINYFHSRNYHVKCN